MPKHINFSNFPFLFKFFFSSRSCRVLTFAWFSMYFSLMQPLIHCLLKIKAESTSGILFTLYSWQNSSQGLLTYWPAWFSVSSLPRILLSSWPALTIILRYLSPVFCIICFPLSWFTHILMKQNLWNCQRKSACEIHFWDLVWFIWWIIIQR